MPTQLLQKYRSKYLIRGRPAVPAGGGGGGGGTPAQPVPSGIFTLPHDKIPDFGGAPTISSVATGNWSSPSTWDLGRVPQLNDVVKIASGHTVTYDVTNTAPTATQSIACVSVWSGGTLTWRTDIVTQLTCVVLLCKPGGTLNIGTASAPVTSSGASIFFADVPINQTIDPSSFSNGLIGLGRVSIYGEAKSNTFSRATTDLNAGAMSVTLNSSPTNWHVGDRIVFPDSRQLLYEETPEHPSGLYVNQTEVQTVTAVTGATVTFAPGLIYNHKAVKDYLGVVVKRPHVGNLSRNVVFRSANPAGTRFHAFMADRADFDVQYAEFRDGGRTTNSHIDNTTFSTFPTVTHYGTNQQGRYPFHVHHVYGPSTPRPSYQFTIKGCAIHATTQNHGRRWGMSIHDSHFGLIQGNVVHNWEGWGIGTEEGNETGNLFDGNFIAHVTNPAFVGELDITDDNGRVGAGMWLHGYNNYITNNVLADTYKGLDFWAIGLFNADIPNGPGKSTEVPGEFTTVDMEQVPILQCDGNEVYGGQTVTGMTIYSMQADGLQGHINPSAPEAVIRNFCVWNCRGRAFYNYKTNKLTFDGAQFYNDWDILRSGIGGTYGFFSGDYQEESFTVKNSIVQGHQIGYDAAATADIGFGLVIKDSFFCNYQSIYQYPMYTQSPPKYPTDPGYPGEFPVRREITINNVTFADPGMADRSDWGPAAWIYMDGNFHFHYSTLIYELVTNVIKFNGIAGDDFAVYFNEQVGSYVLPQTTYYPDGVTVFLLGSPEAGKTNAQNLADHGICYAAHIAPVGAHARAKVFGLVNP